MIIDGTKLDPCEHWKQLGLIPPYFKNGWPDVEQFIPSDTEDKYKNQPADFKEFWDKIPMDYVINSWGFRSPEIDDSKKLLPFFGCSYTFGIGMPVEHTFPYLMSKELGIDYVNFAIPGGGYDGVYRLMKAWLPLIDCDYVVTMDPPSVRIDSQFFNFNHGRYGWEPEMTPNWYRKRFPDDWESRWKPKHFITVHSDNIQPESEDLKTFKLYGILGEGNLEMANLRAVDAITYLCMKHKKTWIRLKSRANEYPFWEIPEGCKPSKSSKYIDWTPPGIEMPVKFLPDPTRDDWQPLGPDERGKYVDLGRDMHPHPLLGKLKNCNPYLAHPGFWFHRFTADIGIKRINDLRSES